MTINRFWAATSIVALAACNPSSPSDGATTTVDLGDQPVETPPPPPSWAPDDSPDAANDGYPDLTPSPLDPVTERTETGARNVLLSFARAIELAEWDQAWAMLGNADREKWSRAEWREMFAGLEEISVAVPDGRMEGAAGSSYYTSDATITARDADGRPVRYAGRIVLRRVNDIPGATEQQLRWHIDSLTLDWTH